MRIKQRGLARARKGERGDILCELQIISPREVSQEERDLIVRLKDISNFDPRK